MSRWTAAVPIRRRDGTLVADVGENCDRLPTRDIGWLADGGWIVPASDPDPQPDREVD